MPATITKVQLPPMPYGKGEGRVKSKEEIDSWAVQIARTFQFQSYFDSTALQGALVTNPSNTQIVQLEEHQFPGYALTLHPSSQTPIAVTAKAFGTGGASGTFIVAPGQTITPFGTKKFRSFKWGLPIGWLGGGTAQIIVSQNLYEPEGVSSRPEVVFHRARFKIYQPAGITSGAQPNAPVNWPSRFPWINAVNPVGVNQSGSANIVPEPTRILMALRGITSLPVAASVIAVIQGSNEFNLDDGGVAGAIGTETPVFDQITFPAWNSLGTSGNLSAQAPVIELEPSAHPLVRIGADGTISLPPNLQTSGIVFIDASGAGVLTGGFIDVVRYGRL